MTLKDDLDRAQFSAVVARDSLSHAEAEVERLRARVRTLEGVLRMAEPILAEAAEPEPMYGGFHGGDPRDFTPDPECSTEEERAKHRADCERWNRGEATGPEPDSHSLCTEGEVVLHVARCGYGLGTSMLRDERAEQALTAARRALSGDAQGGEG